MTFLTPNFQPRVLIDLKAGNGSFEQPVAATARATVISRLARTTSSYECVVIPCRTSLLLAFVDSTTGVSFKGEQRSQNL